MDSGRKLRLSVVLVVCLLTLTFGLSACFRQTQPAAPTAPDADTPLFSDADIDAAVLELAEEEALEAASEPEELPEPTEEQTTVGDLAPQAVLPNARGQVVYVWNDPAATTNPWRILSHDERTDLTTTVYAGSREIGSVAVSGDGNTLVFSMKETTDAASDFEVYRAVLSPKSTGRLTNNTSQDTNVSMSTDAGLFVWEGERNVTPGVRQTLIRDNTLNPVKTTVLNTTQTQPSISSNGEFITMLRRNSSTNTYQVVLYNRAANTYTAIRNTTRVLSHPSPSNDGKKVAWLEVVSATNNSVFIRDLNTNTNTVVYSNASTIDHPHLSGDGNYLTYAQLGASFFAVFTRDLATGQQANTSDSATANATQPYWQQPAPTPPPPPFDADDIQIGGGAGSLPIAFGKGFFTFDASAADGTNFQWNFGDGTSANDQYASKSYDTPGLYTVTLSFTDVEGKPQSFSRQVAVNPEIHEMAATRNLKEGDTISFDVGATLPGLSYQWKVDGGETSSTIDGPTGSSPTLTKLGTYTYTLTITDNRTPALRDGELSPQAVPVSYTTPEGYVTFWKQQPVAIIKATTTTVSEVPVGNAPLTVNFDGTDSTSFTDRTYTWDFGDGTTAEGATQSKVYTTEGRYLVTLKIKDQYNQEDTANTFVYVKNENFRATFNMSYPAPTAITAREISEYLEQEELAELSTTQFGVTLRSDSAQAVTAELQALEAFTSQANVVSIYPYYFPYVVHNAALLNGTVDPLVLKLWSQEPLGQTLPYFNGSEIPEININTGNFPRSSWTYSFLNCDRGNRVGLCDALFFFVNGAAFPKPLPSNRLNDVSVITALNNNNGFILGHEFNAFANLRVPKVFIAVVPDETLVGEQVSPFLTENTIEVNGKKELMLQVLVRESEATSYVEFDLPVYAVDTDGKQALHANGFFKARVPNVESYTLDGVMVQGKAYIHMKLPVGSYVEGGLRVDLTKIEVFHNSNCGTSTIFTLNEKNETINSTPVAKTSVATLNGCSTITTSNEAPTGITSVEPYDYTFDQQALVGINKVVYGRTPTERKSISERLKDVGPVVAMVIWNGLPFLSDGTDLIKQAYNTATGGEVDPVLATLAAAGLILDSVTGGVGDVTVGIKIVYKESKRIGGFFAEAITETVVRAITEGKTASVMFTEVTTQLGDVVKLFLNGGLSAVKSVDDLATGFKTMPVCPIVSSVIGQITAQACGPVDVQKAVNNITTKALDLKVSVDDIKNALTKVCCAPISGGKGYITGAENLTDKLIRSNNPNDLVGVLSHATVGDAFRDKGFAGLEFPKTNKYNITVNGTAIDTEPDLIGFDPKILTGNSKRVIEVKSGSLLKPSEEEKLLALAALPEINARPSVVTLNISKINLSDFQTYKDNLRGKGIDVLDVNGTVLNP